MGHSDEARDMLPKMLVGEFKGEVRLALNYILMDLPPRHHWGDSYGAWG